MKNKDKEDRKNNIVIKGLKVKEITKKRIEEFLNIKLGVKVGIVDFRNSKWSYFIATLEEKEKVMISKKRLKGEEIFLLEMIYLGKIGNCRKKN